MLECCKYSTYAFRVIEQDLFFFIVNCVVYLICTLPAEEFVLSDEPALGLVLPSLRALQIFENSDGGNVKFASRYQHLFFIFYVDVVELAVFKHQVLLLWVMHFHFKIIYNITQ